MSDRERESHVVWFNLILKQKYCEYCSCSFEEKSASMRGLFLGDHELRMNHCCRLLHEFYEKLLSQNWFFSFKKLRNDKAEKFQQCQPDSNRSKWDLSFSAYVVVERFHQGKIVYAWIQCMTIILSFTLSIKGWNVHFPIHYLICRLEIFSPDIFLLFYLEE